LCSHEATGFAAEIFGADPKDLSAVVQNPGARIAIDRHRKGSRGTTPKRWTSWAADVAEQLEFVLSVFGIEAQESVLFVDEIDQIRILSAGVDADASSAHSGIALLYCLTESSVWSTDANIIAIALLGKTRRAGHAAECRFTSLAGQTDVSGEPLAAYALLAGALYTLPLSVGAIGSVFDCVGIFDVYASIRLAADDEEQQ
jgi:hypothetical protein